MRNKLLSLVSLCLLVAAAFAVVQPDDALPSWRDGDARDAIVDFVQRVTKVGGDEFVPPAERIAVFDNDGTLWAEQPLYFQALYIFDRVAELAPEHPEWKTTEPFASILKGDVKAALAGGEEALLELMAATHGGISTEDFSDSVRSWLEEARHPKTGKRFDEMVYQPMLEVLEYLRANGFKTFIISGGGIDFMRVFAEEVYGIPPEQVFGSSVAAEYKLVDGVPTIVKLPKLHFFDDKEGKPVGVHMHIGRRPIAAFGNSDGDFQMLEWTTAGPGARLGLYVHHDDAEREWAYDRESHIGKLARGLDEAESRGWTLVSMKDDWKRIFPFDEPR
ncbi:MAG: haloacid dehalogenase-like hydrolase [Planctomycetes bacterium]|nr:haloacid dehalogenase-like hydrolase [Planctomycetota bacterium]